MYLFFSLGKGISVDELKPESGATEAKKTTKLMRAASFFPENYATCIDFVTILWDKLLISS